MNYPLVFVAVLSVASILYGLKQVLWDLPIQIAEMSEKEKSDP